MEARNGQVERLVIGLDGSASSEAAQRWATEVFPEADRSTVTVRSGDVAAELLRLADGLDATAVVVGHRTSGVPGQVVGHVTASLLHRSSRPVVIVPAGWTPERTDGRPVAIGVGVARGTKAALRWVLSQPALTSDGLLLVHAHGIRSLFRPDGWLDVLAYHLDPTVLPGWVENDLVGLAVELQREAGVEVDVAVTVQPGRIGARLVEAGADAGLLVIGRGEPPFIRTRVLAPYLRHAITHAPCPVVVVPAVGE
jgi:nucleotide-binding universal stress UspA family protein